MVLLPSLWQDMDDFHADPWRLHRDLIPSWRIPKSPVDDFGFGFHPFDMPDVFKIPKEFRQMEQRGRDMQRRLAGNCTDVVPTTGKDGFQVCMDVQQFQPNEITVKTTDNLVVIEGKHEERPDEHGHIMRHFIRRYTLPNGYDSSLIVSELSTDGVLTVKAPKPANAIEGNNERIVSIQHIGPALLNVKDNKPIEQGPPLEGKKKK